MRNEATQEGNMNIQDFMLGALLGGALGVLFAPTKGSKLRDSIKTMLNNAMSDVQGQADMIRSNLEDTVEDVKGKAQDISNDIGSKVKDEKGMIEGKVEDFKNKGEKELNTKLNK